MGNVLSSAPTGGRADITSESETMTDTNAMLDVDRNEDIEEEFYDSRNYEEDRTAAKEKEMNEFRKQLDIKREQRREILARHRAEKEELEKMLQNVRASKMQLHESNDQLRELLMKNNIEIPDNLQSSKEYSELTEAITKIREDFEKLKSDNKKLRQNLVESNSALQCAYSDIADLSSQNTESIKQIHALKEVVTVSKTLISLREGQLNELKDKLNEIELSLADRETNMLSSDLRQEYERQLQNIRTLRSLYQERARLAEVTRQSLARELEEQKILYQAQIIKCGDLTAKVEELEAKVDTLQEAIDNKNIKISTCQDETNSLKAEMAVVNKLFSQVLLGYKTKQDLDILVHRLEENHGLLTHMAEQENGSEASSALPKLLLELVSQVDEGENNNYSYMKHHANQYLEQKEKSTEELNTDNSPNTTAEEIVENLPKVWKVLTELLSHQSVTDGNSSEKVTTCYKSVETKSGPVLVPSVSQTYIRLKDLIIEKLGLIKEVNRMKQLNSHLETRLGEQERRLCLVTTELSKTWHVVGRLRRHHHQLHTHEKILKYELQQKRKLLNELKEELQYCREKWEQAREKNTQSEKDWKKLRAEFSSRKTKLSSPSFNNSGESGYSDEKPSDESSESNDESEYVAEPLIRCKKKIKKSFETILDSSADFNLAAEREDPVSDLLDVADLPLDTHDGEDGQEVFSECSKSENCLQSDKTCETEDEIGDITQDDLHTEDLTVTSQYDDNNSCGDQISVKETENIGNQSISNSSTSLASVVSAPDKEQAIYPAIKLVQQNQTSTEKNKQPIILRINSADLLNKTQQATKNRENSSLPHINNLPTCSSNNSVEHTIISFETQATSDVATGTNNLLSLDEQPELTHLNHINNNLPVNKNMTSKINVESDSHSSSYESEILQGIRPLQTESSEAADVRKSESTIDFKAILENVKRQSDRLARRDERLENMENGCNEVIKNISGTLSAGKEIIDKLDTLHREHQNTDKPDRVITENGSEKGSSSVNKELFEPSTSSEIDHEARFAARDLRLKRLEEQTKSLVNKVNKTTTKGVKIHYKLEELHNIYGSENSRAGTPIEDGENKNNDNDDTNNDNE